MEREGREYVIIDTAGVRRRSKVHQVIEKFSVIKTLKAVEDANVVLLIIDAREGIAEQDLGLLGFALNAGRALVIAVNKWDGIDQGIKDRVKSELERQSWFYRLCPYSLFRRCTVPVLAIYLNRLKKPTTVLRAASVLLC